MKLHWLTITYIVVFFVVPISIILTLLFFRDFANIIGLLIIPLFGGLMTPLRSIKDLERIGFEKTNQIYLTLAITFRVWGGTSLIFITMYSFQLYYVFTTQPNYFMEFPEARIVPIASLVSLFTFVLSFFAYTVLKTRDFRLFMSREYCKIATLKEKRLERTQCLLECLFWYEGYIRLVLRRSIAQIDNIRSMILTQDIDEQRGTLDSFHKAFVDGDELEPLVMLRQITKANGAKMLVKESAILRLKQLAVPITIILAILGVIGQFVGIFLRQP